MSTSHPLNQAVIAQALYDLRNGQLRRCKAMGFGEAELDAAIASYQGRERRFGRTSDQVVGDGADSAGSGHA